MPAAAGAMHDLSPSACAILAMRRVCGHVSSVYTNGDCCRASWAAGLIVFATPVGLCEHFVGFDHAEQRGGVDFGTSVRIRMQFSYELTKGGGDLIAARRWRNAEPLIEVRLLDSLFVWHWLPPERGWTAPSRSVRTPRRKMSIRYDKMLSCGFVAR